MPQPQSIDQTLRALVAQEVRAEVRRVLAENERRDEYMSPDHTETAQ